MTGSCYDDSERLHTESKHLRNRLIKALLVVDAVETMIASAGEAAFIRIVPDTQWNAVVKAVDNWRKTDDTSSS